MGKSGRSPGRWIKTVLFGKKSSSKSREKTGNEKDVLISAKASEMDVVSLNPVISHPTPVTANRAERGLELESNETTNILLDGEIMFPRRQDMNLQGISPKDEPSDPEKLRQEEAATTVQAAFRGYLARRAFWALKGIIRLQALIRGHLVRRQAVATLCSVLGIVKLQALARGRKEGKLVYSGGIIQMAKLSTNAFVRKLLASSPTVMPLRLQYDSTEPNSVASWVERWSASCFWRTVPQPKKIPHSKAQKKLGNGQIVEAETSRPKRSVRRVPAASVDSNPVQATSEFEKPKRSLRKVSSHPADTVQENPQNELEKVKRNLRKVHNPVVENSVPSEIELEKPKQTREKVSGDAGDTALGQNMSHLGEKMKKETTLTTPKQIDAVKNEKPLTTMKLPDVETTPEPLEMDKESKVSHDDQAVVEPKLLVETASKDENTPITNGDLSRKEDSDNNENQKSGRKASNLPKQERAENGLQSSPAIPSYMAATESAKAKLRAQGSPRFSQDGADKNSVTRRHSLPSSTNSKVSSQSPRTQRAINSGGKLGNKSDRSLLSSRDGNAKGAQVEWRR